MREAEAGPLGIDCAPGSASNGIGQEAARVVMDRSSAVLGEGWTAQFVLTVCRLARRSTFGCRGLSTLLGGVFSRVVLTRGRALLISDPCFSN